MSLGSQSSTHSHAHLTHVKQAMQVSSDPAVLAMIDAQHVPVNLKLTKDDAASIAVCEPHGLEVCKDCDLDFFQMNITSRVLQSFPPEMPIPPPPNVVHPQRSPMVQKAKDEGNVRPTPFDS